MKLAVIIAWLFLSPPTAPEDGARVITYRYDVEVEAPAADAGAIDVFVPIPQETPQQEILSQTIDASFNGAVETEGRYGNTLWHGHLVRAAGAPITVSVVTKVRRKVFHNDRLAGNNATEVPEVDKRNMALFLGPNARVPVGGKLVEAISAGIAPDEKGLALIARAIYDYVVDNMEYKKVGDGWGNGDTHWACSERYGNCTDFHALFISLARHRGIPAKFAIGSAIALDKPAGEASGYHCWVEFFIPGAGWVPIDASEAKKHPEKRDLLFGTHPADRVELSVGRDLVLGEGHRGKPLNYFVYPYVEVGGAPYAKVTRQVTFESESDPHH